MMSKSCEVLKMPWTNTMLLWAVVAGVSEMVSSVAISTKVKVVGRTSWRRESCTGDIMDTSRVFRSAASG